jgi:hypothetical protein
MKEAGYEWNAENKELKMLEKQEERESVDKVEPKFKVGDCVTNGHCRCKISFIDSCYWYSETCVLGDITSIDKTFHLWTIADAKDGDVLALKAVDKLGEYLGIALSHIACVVDPDVFIIGGGVSKAGSFLIDAITKHYVEKAFHQCRKTPVKLATLGNSAGIYGAAKLVLC